MSPCLVESKVVLLPMAMLAAGRHPQQHLPQFHRHFSQTATSHHRDNHVASFTHQRGSQAGHFDRQFTPVDAARARRPPIPVLVDERRAPDLTGTYSFRYETGDGSMREESASPAGPDTLQVRGSYIYEAPDGTQVQVRYVADDKGFRAESPVLPTPPPAPPHALRQIAAAEEEFARQRQEERAKHFGSQPLSQGQHSAQHQQQLFLNQRQQAFQLQPLPGRQTVFQQQHQEQEQVHTTQQGQPIFSSQQQQRRFRQRHSTQQQQSIHSQQQFATVPEQRFLVQQTPFQRVAHSGRRLG